jgi:hypothetical protein
MRRGSIYFRLADGAGSEYFSQLLEGCNMTGWDVKVRRCGVQSLLDIHDPGKNEISSGS